MEKKSTYHGYTETRKKANKNYETNTVERISLVLPKGKKAIIKECAEKQGESVNSFINKAIDTRINRDSMI